MKSSGMICFATDLPNILFSLTLPTCLPSDKIFRPQIRIKRLEDENTNSTFLYKYCYLTILTDIWQSIYNYHVANKICLNSCEFRYTGLEPGAALVDVERGSVNYLLVPHPPKVGHYFDFP